MVGMEQTKKPTRDYPSYSSTPWELWEVLYARRSHRKFMPSQKTRESVSSLEDTVCLALSVRGAAEDSLRVVTDRDLVAGIKTRLHKGMQGKINLWLHRSPVQGFLVLAMPKSDVRAERPRELPLTAMCWLGGLNQGEVRKALNLGHEIFVPAVIPFGRPKPRVKARDMDHVMYRSISRKRKPLQDIAYRETIDRIYSLPEIPKREFTAAGVQDVAGLLRQLRERDDSDTGVPLDLAVDACLEAARISPSAGNTQKWRFVVVSGEDALRELERACGVENAWKTAIIGVGDTEAGFLYEKLEKPFWMIDLPIAFSQMSLVAASMGLAVDLGLRGIDEKAVNAIAGLRPPLRSVGVMGIR